MLLKVIDGQGALQTLVSHGQELILADHSGVADGTPDQEVMPANPLRSGWILQNTHAVNVIAIRERTTAGVFAVHPGEFFPPAGFPVTVGAVTLTATAGTTWAAREW